MNERVQIAIVVALKGAVERLSAGSTVPDILAVDVRELESEDVAVAARALQAERPDVLDAMLTLGYREIYLVGADADRTWKLWPRK